MIDSETAEHLVMIAKIAIVIGVQSIVLLAMKHLFQISDDIHHMRRVFDARMRDRRDG